MSLSLYCSFVQGQDKSDYTWILGKNFTNDIGGEGNLIDFSTFPPSISTQSYYPAQALGNCLSLMCDRQTGKLLFYSNGCVIYGKDHQIMQNGDDLNPGNVREYFCEKTQTKWYPSGLSLLALPDPSNIDNYYLFHKTIRDEDNRPNIIDSLRYSYIDMLGNDGNGVVEKKNKVFSTIELDHGINATKHRNNEDWWIIVRHKNKACFSKFLLDSDGIQIKDVQCIGDTVNRSGYQQSFSPDGSQFALYNGGNGLQVFDFNNNDGLLTNHRTLPIEDGNLRGGLSFSPSGRFVYCINRAKIYQVDLEEPTLAEGLILIDTLRSPPPPYGITWTGTFAYAMLGPDCRIYISAWNGTKWLTTIDYPDEKGIACNVQQYTFELPYANFISAIPNLPHYRSYVDSPCRAPSSTKKPVVSEDGFNIYPNPASQTVNIVSTASGMLELINSNGIQVSKTQIDTGDNALDISSYANGIYLLRLITKDQKVLTKKLFLLN